MITKIVDSTKCCGCGACASICHRNALSVVEDIEGFLSVKCDMQKCVDCGACDIVCPIINVKTYNAPVAAYAAAYKEESILKKSTSGGVFAALAIKVLSEKGIVYGAAWTKDFKVMHIGISDIRDLELIQSSKYIQSNIINVFSEIKEHLNSKKDILFSGTPCQIMALHNYLKKDYDNLLLVDIVCHGVGNHKMLLKDIEYLEDRYNGKISELSFRSKIRGWGTSGYIKIGSKSFDYNIMNSPYYYFFLNGDVFRESCYSCQFARGERVGDITLGDYWGVETAIPNSNISSKKGVSCVLINSKKGETAFSDIRDQLIVEKSRFDEIQKRNAQLSSPSKMSPNTSTVKKLYKADKYNLITEYWKKISIKQRCSFKLKSLIPSRIKVILKKITG